MALKTGDRFINHTDEEDCSELQSYEVNFSQKQTARKTPYIRSRSFLAWFETVALTRIDVKGRHSSQQ